MSDKKFTFRDEDAQKEWEEGLAANSDFYGRGVYVFAERWAILMEERLAADTTKTVADVAEKASHDADTDGITGFMYGCAVGILSRAWVHGEQLRRWSNRNVQIANEGDEANEKEGAVLNPALLCVTPKK